MQMIGIFLPMSLINERPKDVFNNLVYFRWQFLCCIKFVYIILWYVSKQCILYFRGKLTYKHPQFNKCE